MQPLDEYPIGSERGSTAPTLSSREEAWRVWAVVGICMAIAVAAVAFFYVRPSNEPGASSTETAPTAAQQTQQARGPLGAPVEPRELPALDLTDPVVRELLSGMSSRPELATWLATDDLLRNVAAVIDDVANGTAPSTHLRRLAPSGGFTAQPRGSEFVIDASSFHRYNGIADTVASLDAEGLARAYSTLRPRLQEAYRELGYPDGNIDAAVERAVVRLLGTRPIREDVSVRPAPVLFRFADERLEALSPAEKQLLRMGPRNQRIVQEKLRDVAGALGIAAERLPPT